jgi:hypothetical protein
MPINSLLIAGVLASSAPPTASEDLMVTFIRAFCLVEQDRLEAAERLVPAGWTITERQERRGISYGIDAPLPIHDVVKVEWRGRVGDAVMWLSVRRYDYLAPLLHDHSTARFGVSPDTAINLASLQRRAPIVMEPRWQSIAGDVRPRVEVENSVHPGQPRRYGSLQHYILRAQSDPPVQMTARHFRGVGFPDQRLDVSCSTDLSPAVIDPTGSPQVP